MVTDVSTITMVVLCFAQVALGSVTNIEEAVKWLSYTYLYVRMRANPLAYGINHKAYQVGYPHCHLLCSPWLSAQESFTMMCDNRK